MKLETMFPSAFLSPLSFFMWLSPLMDLQGLPLAAKGLTVWAIGKVYETTVVPTGNVGKRLGPSDETIDWELGFSFEHRAARVNPTLAFV